MIVKNILLSYVSSEGYSKTTTLFNFSLNLSRSSSTPTILSIPSVDDLLSPPISPKTPILRAEPEPLIPQATSLVHFSLHPSKTPSTATTVSIPSEDNSLPPLILQEIPTLRTEPKSLGRQDSYVPMILPVIRQKLFSCNHEKEINRCDFTFGMLIGEGHFGKVFKGIATGLDHPSSKTCVAVKTTNDTSNGDGILSLVCEAEILSNLEKHLNLVNLLGICSSHFSSTGELWLLLEYCNEGDMKHYLQKLSSKMRRNETGVNVKKL